MTEKIKRLYSKPVAEQIVTVDRQQDEALADALAQRRGVIPHLPINARGPSLVLGTSDYWDLPRSDHRAYLMGYRYFSHEPWHWPVFVTHTMNVPYPKSIAFSDSIPIWAFINKVIGTVDPSQRAR